MSFSKLPIITINSFILILLLVSASEGIIRSNGKAVLITGCDSEFGHQLTHKLNGIGYKVYATVRNTSTEASLKNALIPDKVIVLQMDITSDNQVNEVFEKVRQDLSNSGYVLWALVNSESTESFGPLELGTLDSIKHLFEVNVFGTARVTRTFLPLIRSSKGRITNLVSVLGRHSSRYLGHNAMTKHAVLSFSDILRREVSRFGISVSIIEHNQVKPQSTNTQLLRDWVESMDDVKKSYESYETLKEKIERFLNYLPKDDSIDSVVGNTIDSIINLKPKTNYNRMFSVWHLITIMNTLLPSTFTDLFCRTAEEFYFEVLGYSNKNSYFPSNQLIKSILKNMNPNVVPKEVVSLNNSIPQEIMGQLSPLQNPIEKDVGPISPTIQTPIQQNPVSEKSTTKAPVLQNAGLQNPMPREPTPQNSIPQTPTTQNPIQNSNLQNPMPQNLQNPSLKPVNPQNTVHEKPIPQNLVGGPIASPILSNPYNRPLPNQNPYMQNANQRYTDSRISKPQNFYMNPRSSFGSDPWSRTGRRINSRYQ